MLPALLLGGVAATYLHKKFPRSTEAIAKGIVTGTAWTAKKVAEAVSNHYSTSKTIDTSSDTRRVCCIESFAKFPRANFCATCGQRDGKLEEEYKY